jgi:hypothetical protein
MAILKRHIPDGDLDYTPGSIVNVDLPRENFWRRVFLWLVADGDSATEVANAPMSEAYQEIRVMVDNQVLKSYKGQELAALNIKRYGGSLQGHGQDTGAVKTSGDELGLCIDFGLSPTDYRHMVASAELSSFYLQIVWSPIASMDAHATPTWDANLKIHSDEVVADDIPASQLGLVQEREISSPVISGAANTWNTMKMPLGNIYRSFTAWSWFADLYKLGGLSLVADLFSVLHNGNVVLQDGYVDAFELEDYFDQRRLSVHVQGETQATDYAFYERMLTIDFDKDVANLDEVLDTARSSSLDFKIREDGGGDGTNDSFKVVTEEIIP